MGNVKLGDTRENRWSTPFRYCVFIFLQALLFLSAAAALTLFYLSYRVADFYYTFIAAGLLLTGPWLLVSLLPTFFGLEDKELRREIAVRQIVSMLVIIAALVGFAFYHGFQQKLWGQIGAVFTDLWDVIRESLRFLSIYLAKLIDAVSTLFNEKVLPLFSE